MSEYVKGTDRNRKNVYLDEDALEVWLKIPKTYRSRVLMSFLRIANKESLKLGRSFKDDCWRIISEDFSIEYRTTK